MDQKLATFIMHTIYEANMKPLTPEDGRNECLDQLGVICVMYQLLA